MALLTAFSALFTYRIGLLSGAITHIWQLGGGYVFNVAVAFPLGPLSNGGSLRSLLLKLLSHTGRQNNRSLPTHFHRSLG